MCSVDEQEALKSEQSRTFRRQLLVVLTGRHSFLYFTFWVGLHDLRLWMDLGNEIEQS